MVEFFYFKRKNLFVGFKRKNLFNLKIDGFFILFFLIYLI